jgi:hypothetical protein
MFFWWIYCLHLQGCRVNQSRNQQKQVVTWAWLTLQLQRYRCYVPLKHLGFYKLHRTTIQKTTHYRQCVFLYILYSHEWHYQWEVWQNESVPILWLCNGPVVALHLWVNCIQHDSDRKCSWLASYHFLVCQLVKLFVWQSFKGDTWLWEKVVDPDYWHFSRHSDGLEAGRLRNRFGKGKRFLFLLCSIHSSSEAHLASYQMGTRGSFPGDKAATAGNLCTCSAKVMWKYTTTLMALCLIN